MSSRVSTISGPLDEGTDAYPRPVPGAPTGPRVPKNATYENLVYRVEPGFRPLFLDLKVPVSASADHPAPIVVWVHGGGWLFGTRRRQAPNIASSHVIDRIVGAGYAVALVDYRLIREAQLPAQLHDLRAAVQWLRSHAAEYRLDPTRVALWGESAGAHLALLTGLLADPEAEDQESGLARKSRFVRLSAVVDWYGPADLTEILAQRAAAQPVGDVSIPVDSGETTGTELDPISELLAGNWGASELSPVFHVSPGAPPIFIAHGRQDSVVPIDQSRRLFAALSRADVITEIFEADGDHVFAGSSSIDEATDRSIAFLDCHLGAAAPRPTDPNVLDSDIARLEARMARSSHFPIFDDNDNLAVSGVPARQRGIVLRDTYYPKQFFDVESVQDETIPGTGMRVRIQKPYGGSDSTVVYFHGGGWIIGDLDSHEGNASRIAARAHAWVVQVDYRLAPEHPFPAAYDDAIAAIEWVRENIARFGGDLTKVVLSGDSAGGNIAAATALHCRDAQIPIAAQLLIYPATDLRGAGAQQVYVGGDEALVDDPRVSPILGRLEGLPPVIMGVGPHDFLYADNLAYANALRAAGVDVDLRVYAGLNHGFFSYGSVSTASDAAADDLVAALREHLHARH